MITIEELFAKVEKKYGRDFDDNEYFKAEWEKMKETLIPHIETYPGKPFIDEYGNEDYEEIEETVSYAETEEDELAYFCWRCGCNLYTSQSWYDGSYSFYISLPKTEEQYQENLREAKKWWNEVMEE